MGCDEDGLWLGNSNERCGGILGAEQLRCWVVKLAVTLLQLSHCAACSNTQHCLTLLTCYCSAVSTMLIDTPDRQVIIIDVTNGYTSFLSEPVSIPLLYMFVVCWGWRAMREGRGVCNSITTVRNLTNLIVGTDRYLLAVIVGCRAIGLSGKVYLTLVHVHVLMGHGVAQFVAEQGFGFNSR